MSAIKSTVSGEGAERMTPLLPGLTPRVPPVMVKALAELRRESEQIAEQMRAASAEPSGTGGVIAGLGARLEASHDLARPAQTAVAGPSSAEGLIAALSAPLGAPLDPAHDPEGPVQVAAPGSVSAGGLIAALGAPLGPNHDPAESVQAALAKTAKAFKGSSVNAVKAQATQVVRNEPAAMHQETVLAFFACYSSCAIADFINPNELLALDIFKHLKAAFEKMRGLKCRVEEFVNEVPSIAILVQFLKLSNLPPNLAKSLPTISVLIQRLKVLDDNIANVAIPTLLRADELLQDPSSTNKARLSKKATEALAKHRRQLFDEALADFNRARASLRIFMEFLSTHSSVPIPSAMFKLLASRFKEFEGFKVDAKKYGDRALCLEELRCYVEMMDIGFKLLPNFNRAFAKKSISLFIKALNEFIKNKYKLSAANDIREGFHSTLNYISRDLVMSASETNPHALLQIFLSMAVAQFCHAFQQTFEVLILEPAFPGFIPKEIHYLNLIKRCKIFYDIIERRGLPGSHSNPIDQIVLLGTTTGKCSRVGAMDLLTTVQLNCRRFSNHQAYNYFLLEGALGFATQDLKTKILPTLDRLRQEQLESAERLLRQKGLEELTQNRAALEKELLPLYAPDIEDLCHFILYLKRYEHFVNRIPTQDGNEKYHFVPVELVNYLVLEGIDDLFDRLIDEKTKAAPAAAATAAAAPAKPKAAAAAAAPPKPKAEPVAAATAPAAAPLKISRGDKFRAVLRRLEEMGYEVRRQTGSHIILARLQEGGENSVVLPNHPQFAPGTARSIENQANRG